MPGSLAAAADSSTPHTLACLQLLVLWSSCALRSPGPPHRQQSPSVSPSVLPRTCPAEFTSCAQVHTPVHSPPHTILNPCIHRCTPATESSTAPTQFCAMTAQPPCPAAPCTAAHPRPSPCTHIYTHVSHRSHILQPLHAASTPSRPSAAASPSPRLPTSCTHAYLHAHTSPRIPDPSHRTTIFSQQPLREQPLSTKHNSHQLSLPRPRYTSCSEK